MMSLQRLVTVLVAAGYLFLIGAAVLMFAGIANAANLTTSNLSPTMSGMTASEGTSVGTGTGCQTGKYCTSGTIEGGGTYSSSFEIPLTRGELNQGFVLNSGVTINSHSSNSFLASCSDGVLQQGDCRDISKLTITLKDGENIVEHFVHTEELSWAGLKDFSYADNVAANDYGILTGYFELWGIDAGYPVAYHGPQYSNPTMTLDYQTALVITEIPTIITDLTQPVIETETTSLPNTTIAIAAVDTATQSVDTYMTMTAPTNPTASTVSIAATATSPPVGPVAVDTTSAMNTDLAAPVSPTIAPIASQTETQQAEATQAEATIEAAIEPAAAEPAAAEPAVAEVAAAKPAAPAAKVKQKAKTKSRKMVAAPATIVPLPVTPAAVAAQTAVDNIAPSQKYSSASQTLTLVAMQIISQTRGLFKRQGIPDSNFLFKTTGVPDGPSMTDIMQNYRMTGQANAVHDALVETQWKN